MAAIILNAICLEVCVIGRVWLFAPGTQKICWEIKIWAVFSSVSLTKPSDTSYPTSEAKWSLLIVVPLLPFRLSVSDSSLLGVFFFPRKGSWQVSPFCHHPEPRWTVHHSGRLSDVQEPDRADRTLQGQPHPALWRVPDFQLSPGEAVHPWNHHFSPHEGGSLLVFCRPWVVCKQNKSQKWCWGGTHLILVVIQTMIPKEQPLHQ